MKIKKLLAILSSVLVISACAISPIYAEETATEPTESEQTEEKITNKEEICSLINNFADECKMPGVSAFINESSEMFPIGWIVISTLGETEYNRIGKLINNFIAEKNIDKTNMTSISNEVWIVDWFCDINGDGKADVRDCFYIASSLAKGEKLSYKADYNSDDKVDVRDAAVLSQSLATKKFR